MQGKQNNMFVGSIGEGYLLPSSSNNCGPILRRTAVSFEFHFSLNSQKFLSLIKNEAEYSPGLPNGPLDPCGPVSPVENAKKIYLSDQ